MPLTMLKPSIHNVVSTGTNIAPKWFLWLNIQPPTLFPTEISYTDLERSFRTEFKLTASPLSRPQSCPSLLAGGALSRAKTGSGATWSDWLDSWTRFSLPYCYLFSREYTFAKLGRAYFAGHKFHDLTQKNALEGTKFREICQNTDTRYQTYS